MLILLKIERKRHKQQSATMRQNMELILFFKWPESKPYQQTHYSGQLIFFNCLDLVAILGFCAVKWQAEKYREGIFAQPDRRTCNSILKKIWNVTGSEEQTEKIKQRKLWQVKAHCCSNRSIGGCCNCKKLYCCNSTSNFRKHAQNVAK